MDRGQKILRYFDSIKGTHHNLLSDRRLKAAPLPPSNIYKIFTKEGDQLKPLLPSQSFSQFLQSFLQLQRKLLVTLFADRLHIKLNKFVPKTTKQKPDKVLAAGIVGEKKSILLNVHKQKITTATYTYKYEVIFTRCNYSTLLSELCSFYPNVHIY